MDKKKTLYIVLSVIAVILVAVIIVVAVKLNAGPAGGNQTGADTTTSAVSGDVDNADATTGEADNTTNPTGDNTANNGDNKDNVVKDPGTTIAPVEEEKTGIDFDDLLG